VYSAEYRSAASKGTGRSNGIPGYDQLFYPFIDRICARCIVDKDEMEPLMLLISVQNPGHNFVQMVAASTGPVVQLFGKYPDNRQGIGSVLRCGHALYGILIG
jgi:hypothetical protein